ncbi:MAG TPA: glycosyl hydrolase family 28-related protein [Kiritimatiellia bacterium]|jgi:hypothetical protein|nr:glycosyl hydrolase family 28-related protein [Kiritimatiellia bacterium]HOR97331.1 glycosyl hydrolase family 28-related protein [Kiritimatiellia bacterium]HPK37309.1 glycosyl hydrolase family 28-related protein [Kiritimatiellia bacterium]HPW75377.1 glycosyl hydrolase family 28-related protein [Kiritimatiellia bacterium]
MKKIMLAAATVVSIVCGAETCAADHPITENERPGREATEWSMSNNYNCRDIGKLPRVMLIGDSITAQYQGAVGRELKGKAYYSYWASSYCVASAMHRTLLKAYLTDLKYDVIHFNNGLHSLSTDPKVWARALKAALLLCRELQPQAKLIWCNSTTVEGEGMNEKVIRLNHAALEVCKELGIDLIDDQFSLVAAQPDAHSDAYHLKGPVKELQAKQVAEICLRALKPAVSVVDSGAKGDGVHDDTPAFQRAINAAAADKGTVEVPRGVYFLKALEMKSGVTLHLAAGAHLKGSRRIEDYGEGKDLYGKRLGMIRFLGIRDAAVIGELGSLIDGSNSSSPTEFEARGVHLFHVTGSTNLLFRGYTVVDAGNYAHWFRHCADVRFDHVRIEGGHDGVHFWNSSRVTVEDCEFNTGDDCVAGLDYRDLVVRRCKLNTPCQCLRLGGRRILVEDCELTGPGKHPHRCTLPRQAVLDGLEPAGEGRRYNLAAFLYYCEKDGDVKEDSGEIVVRNCRVRNVQRFFHYNFDGSEIWAQGRPLRDIRFENVTAENVDFPLVAISTLECPTRLTLENCSIAFTKPVPEFIRTAAFGKLTLKNVRLSGVEGPLVRAWGRPPDVVAENVTGASGIKEGAASEKIDAHPILGFLMDYPEHEMSPLNPKNLKRK